MGIVYNSLVIAGSNAREAYMRVKKDVPAKMIIKDKSWIVGNVYSIEFYTGDDCYDTSTIKQIENVEVFNYILDIEKKICGYMSEDVGYQKGTYQIGKEMLRINRQAMKQRDKFIKKCIGKYNKI